MLYPWDYSKPRRWGGVWKVWHGRGQGAGVKHYGFGSKVHIQENQYLRHQYSTFLTFLRSPPLKHIIIFKWNYQRWVEEGSRGEGAGVQIDGLGRQSTHPRAPNL